MKRIFATLAAIGIGIVLVGCGSSADEENPEIKTEPKDSQFKMNSGQATGGPGAGQMNKPLTD